MKCCLVFLPLLAATVLAGCTPSNDLKPDLEALVAAERAFSATSVERGIRTAFLTYLADDGIVFRPTPVEGKPVYAALPEEGPGPGTLAWHPVFADVSRSGDLGYTTGPYMFDPAAEDAPTGYGHYVSLWRRQADGSWRVEIDLGIPHAAPEQSDTTVAYPSSIHTTMKEDAVNNLDLDAERSALLETDRAFSEASASRGTTDAYLAYVTDEIRFYRMGRFPTTGKPALQAALASQTGRYTWMPEAARLSKTADLGYTYGRTETRIGDPENAPAASSSYVRIWKRQSDGTWKVVLDITNPIPPPAPETGGG